MSHAWRGIGAVLLAVTVAGSVGAVGMAAPQAPSGSPITHATKAATFCPDAEERAFLQLINNYRANYRLPALRFSRTLGAAADHHSYQMAKNNYFSHTMLNGVTWSRNIVDHGYTLSTYKGENIAAGRASAADVFAQWRNSPSHNAIMLSATFTAIGIGRGYDASSTYDWYWTTDFGGIFDAGLVC